MMRTIRPRLAPWVADLSPYRLPRHPAPVELDLAANEGAAPPASWLESVPVIDPAGVCRYPDAAPLECLLAERLGIEPDQVLVTAGADDALCRAIRSVGAAGRDVIFPVPAFEMIGRYVAGTGARAVAIRWPSGPFPLDDLLAAACHRTAAVILVSPNNPTGATIAPEQIETIARALPRALIIVDQAYGEYADQDLAGATLSEPAGVLLRSLSKAWGLAGLRVGFAAGSARTIRRMRALGQPYPVASPSLRIASRALREGESFMHSHVERVRDERRRLQGLLSRLGARPFPSQANFVLAEFERPRWVADGLAGMGIAVRRFENEPSLERALRIACPGNASGWRKLSRALQTVMGPEALLFDLDGTLADTTPSLDEAIRETAAGYGVAVTREEIERLRAQGGANSDWALTAALLAGRGVTVDREEITRGFERLYQGTARAPGLRRHERLLPRRAVLERLARRLPLTVVTGRPGRDALRFLADEGISHLFRAVVTADDGPLKPDPAPVRLALREMGVTRAWMIGDTPDDIRAARAAGVLPLGIEPPQASRFYASILLQAGAARVLGRLADIEEILP